MPNLAVELGKPVYVFVAADDFSYAEGLPEEDDEKRRLQRGGPVDSSAPAGRGRQRRLGAVERKANLGRFDSGDDLDGDGFDDFAVASRDSLSAEPEQGGVHETALRVALITCSGRSPRSSRT